VLCLLLLLSVLVLLLLFLLIMRGLRLEICCISGTLCLLLLVIVLVRLAERVVSRIAFQAAADNLSDGELQSQMERIRWKAIGGKAIEGCLDASGGELANVLGDVGGSHGGGDVGMGEIHFVVDFEAIMPVGTHAEARNASLSACVD
jgi:hypothetical protein